MPCPPRRMHPSLLETKHRPWPLPDKAWQWRQSWLDLAFIHYEVDAARLASRLPAGLELDTFGGKAYLGIVPFRMAGVMKRPFPDVPIFSTFPELNVRTYVTSGGKPGVWFFSLDAASLAICLGGRALYHLPYFYAKQSISEQEGSYHFQSSRRKSGVRFEADYHAIGDVFFAQLGSFEHWATERYCLYAHSKRGRLSRVDVHHVPWPLQPAEVSIQHNELAQAAGIEIPPQDSICHFSSGVDVVSYGRDWV